MAKSFFEKLTSSIKSTGVEKLKIKTPLKRVDFKEELEEKPKTLASPAGRKKLRLEREKSEELEERKEFEKFEDFEELPEKEKPLEKKGAPKETSIPQEEGQLTIDVYQTDTDIVIKSTIAGVKADELDIDITNDMVTIKGDRSQDEKIPQENYFYQECYWGPFSRTVILPQDILPDKAQASMKDGILEIILPKAHAITTRKLKVKTSV